MLTRIIFRTLLVVIAASAAAGTIITYRWTDADGVHYSDQPHPGAEKILLGETQTYSSAEAALPVPTPVVRARAASGAAAPGYDSCAIVQPAQDQVLIDVESVTIAVSVRPAKRSSDRVSLSFDGHLIEPTDPGQLEFKITPIDRGTHTVAATVRDSAGKNLCQSPAISFHVRQPSVLAPLNPNNPKRVH